MRIGWVRAYGEENKRVGSKVEFYKRDKRAKFRENFKTSLRANHSTNSDELQRLNWGDVVELPNGLSSNLWTQVNYKRKTGFVKTNHIIEIAFVSKRKNRKGNYYLTANLDYEHFDSLTHTRSHKSKKLIWGDLVQIIKRGSNRSVVRARGVTGEINTNDLTDEPLLDVYFIDVGQGDGVLMRTPDGRHMLIDGGLERTKQQTGKNAADLVDWKFFFDYGDFRVRLDSMMASHSDSDHYGGLHDLLRTSKLADRELDCLGVDVATFHHPGLSRWKKLKNANPPHSEGLGPIKNKAFIRLLDNRMDALAAINGKSTEQLSGPWRSFVKAVLSNSSVTKVERVSLPREVIKAGKPMPEIWRSKATGYSVKVLGPVSRKVSNKEGLPSFGPKSKNTNGHSICLRVDYGSTRILLTGDLNTKSMHWLEKSFGNRIGEWECDVAKACHHGSHDISYRFLKVMKPSATIISSGDAEGYAHPRPEVVAASALTGHVTIDAENDKLLTPLIYMTEIERSVTVGSINRIDIQNVPTTHGSRDAVILGRPIDEINDMGFVSPTDRKKFVGKTNYKERRSIANAIRRVEKSKLADVETDTAIGHIRLDMNLTVPIGPVDKKNVNLRAWRARMMQKTHYGIVTVRTDGTHVMCATMDETAEDWITHLFEARFK